MPTYVYLSNPGATDLKLSLQPVGPTTDYSGSYHLKETTVPAGATDLWVMTIDRGGDLKDHDAIDIEELQLRVLGTYACSLQVMLSQQNLIKNGISWAWRTPTPNLMRFVNDHEPHQVTYRGNGLAVSVTVQGRAATGFDDIYVTVDVTRLPAATRALSDPSARRVIVFAVTPDGHPLLRTTPASGQPTWTDQPASLPAGTRLGTEISLVTSYGDAATGPVIAGLAADGKFWVRPLKQASWTSLDLGAPATPAALICSDIRGPAAGPRCDVFITTSVPGGGYGLYRRTLLLDGAIRFAEPSWDDWGTVLARPSYAPGKERYLVAIRQPALSSAGVYYCYADGQGDNWGRWRNTLALPGDAKPRNVVVYPWITDGIPQREVAILCLSSDGTAFLTGSDNLGQPWKNMQLSGITGEPQAVPISNYVALVARNSRGALEYCLTTPKEVGLSGWTEIPESSGLQDWAAFYFPPAGLLIGTLFLLGPDFAGTDLTCLSTPVSTG